MLIISGNFVIFLSKELGILFCTLLINLISSLIKNIIYINKDQLIFLKILRIIIVMIRGY